MAQYNITLSDGVTIIPIPDGSTTFTAADIPLVGQNTQLYGSPVATAHLHHLENFASDNVPPSVNPLPGQLWYDNGITTLTPSLSVYNGATWDRIANTGVGTTESGTLRWNSTTKAYQEEERVRISDAGELLIALDDTATNVVTIDHSGTDLRIVGTAGTADIDVTGITNVNLPALTLVTVLDETYGGTGVITYAQGDILYASGADTLAALTATTNGFVLTLAGGVPTWASGGAAGTVTSSGGPNNNEVAVFTAATDINSDSTFTWDGTTMFATNVTGTNIGGIASGNLLDKSFNSEVISGTNWDFSGISNSSGQIAATTGTTLRILSNDNTDWVDFSHGSGANDGDFDIVGNATVDLNITGFSGNIVTDAPIHAGNNGAESLRIIGDSGTWSGADSYIRFYDSTQSDFGLEIGTRTADTNDVRINSRIGNLELYAANGVSLTLTPTESTVHITGGIEAMIFRNPFVVGTNASTSATVGDINNAQYNVGYNETPTQSIVSSRDIDIDDIGKFLTRTNSTTRTLTVVNDTDIPVGGSCVVHNAAGGGFLYISPGAITLTWVDGSGSTPASAQRTIANNSVVTLRKVSSSVWQIWGNGIS